MRNIRFLALATLLVVGPVALAGTETKSTGVPAKKAKNYASAGEREAVALAFVHENHPELALLLEPLKSMKPGQYEKAIAELYQVSVSLANQKKIDPKRYEATLEVWKAKSRAEVIAAQLASAASPELKSQLRTALENQVEAQLTQQRLERATVEERLKKLNESIKRLETNRDTIIESRFQGLIKKGQRARRPNEGQPVLAKPARTKGESKP